MELELKVMTLTPSSTCEAWSEGEDEAEGEDEEWSSSLWWSASSSWERRESISAMAMADIRWEEAEWVRSRFDREEGNELILRRLPPLREGEWEWERWEGWVEGEPERW